MASKTVEPEETQLEAPPVTAGDLSKLAKVYHVPMSEGTLKEIAGDKGEVSPQKAQAFEAYLQQAASGLYPTLAPQIQAGIPTGHLLDPYRQIGKQVLGEDYEPNFQSDPHDRAALEGNIDPKTGHPAPMSLSQWQIHLKTDPHYGWQDTPQGQSEVAAMKKRFVAALGGPSDTA